MVTAAGADRVDRVLLEPLDSLGAGLEPLDDLVGVASADGGGEGADAGPSRSGSLGRGRRCRPRLPAGLGGGGGGWEFDACRGFEAVAGGGGQAGAVGGRADDVAEDRAGFDRGELAGVSNEDQPGSGRTDSTRRAINDNETIEVSSTITTSCGSLLARSWRKRL